MQYIKTSIRILSLIVVFASLTSCAAKKELVELEQARLEQNEAINQQKKQNEQLQAELLTIKADQADLKMKNDLLQTENDQLKSQLAGVRASFEEIANQQPPECPEELLKKGIVFKVQIGAYEELEVSEKLTESANLEAEEQNDLQKIVVGQFRDYQKAETLKKKLRTMGVKDAWIVSYKDNKRVSIQTALSELGIK